MGRYFRRAFSISAPGILLLALTMACSVSAAEPVSQVTVTPETADVTGYVSPAATETEPRPTTTSATESVLPTPVEPAVDSPVVTPSVTPTHSPTVEPTPPPTVVESMFGPVECREDEQDISLTHHMYDPEMFDALVPMGRMWGSHVTPTDHMYLRINGQREREMVRTPAAGRVVLVARFPNDQSPHWDDSVTEPDLRIVIAHSCTLFSVFIHLGELAPEIAAVVGDLGPGGQWFHGPGETVELDAGDAIAMFGGSSIDYSLHDETVTLEGFQVPEHYEREPWKVHTVDPFDYMSPDIAAELLAKNEREVEPYGGRIDYDVSGTLAGNWFMDGTVDYSGGVGDGAQEYWNGHLSIAYDHIDPSQVRISIGRDIGLTHDDCRVCGDVYAVLSNSPDPAEVTAADGIVRYELTGRMHVSPGSTERTASDGNVLGTFLAQVIDDAIIRTEFVHGASADEVDGFSDNAVLYRR